MNGHPVIETQELTKLYGNFTAVDHLSLRIEEGEIYGFLGPNGSGKTTTILMLLGLSEPTSGIARVLGYNSTRETLKVKRIAGYLPENVGFYEDLSARENLMYTARLNGMPDKAASAKIGDALALVGLSQIGKQRVGTFSRGMRQRLGIADVLIKDPKVVFLDEPTLGLDPDGANRILDMIMSMSKDQKITVLLSSHLLHQVQKICHRVGILSKGRLVAEGTIESLERELFLGEEITIELQVSDSNPELVNSIGKIEGVTSVEASGDLLRVRCGNEARAQISGTVVASGVSLLQMKTLGYGLDEIYMKYFQEV